MMSLVCLDNVSVNSDDKTSCLHEVLTSVRDSLDGGVGGPDGQFSFSHEWNYILSCSYSISGSLTFCQ